MTERTSIRRFPLAVIKRTWWVLWNLWAFAITVTLLILIIGFGIAEWRSRRALSPDQIELMKPPAVVSEGLLDPFESARPLVVDDGLGIYFATDRAAAGPQDSQAFYRDERGYALRLGVGKVQIGQGDMTWEQLRRVSLTEERSRDHVLHVAGTTEFGVLRESRVAFEDPGDLDADREAPGTAFADHINAKLAAAHRKDVYIYVHGYKVVFENPLLVASALWNYMGYDGAMIAFSWPATPHVLAYVSDIETTRYSARNLRILIQFLAAQTDAERIHILGYSAGTGLVLNALDELALMHADEPKAEVQSRFKLENVILVCSDVDRGIFGNQLANGIWKLPRHLNIYVSRVDSTLGMSQLLFQRDRLGRLMETDHVSDEFSEFLRNQDHVSFIDVTGAENVEANNGHAYFHKSPWVSSDLMLTFLKGLGPESRGLQRSDRNPLWHFPEDYVEQLRSIPDLRAPADAPVDSESGS